MWMFTSCIYSLCLYILSHAIFPIISPLQFFLLSFPLTKISFTLTMFYNTTKHRKIRKNILRRNKQSISPTYTKKHITFFVKMSKRFFLAHRLSLYSHINCLWKFLKRENIQVQVKLETNFFSLFYNLQTRDLKFAMRSSRYVSCGWILKVVMFFFDM